MDMIATIKLINGGIYFAIWLGLAISTSVLYAVRRKPEFRIRWHARIVLAVGVAIGVSMFLVAPQAWPLILAGGGLITYLNLTRVTICAKCGRIVQPVQLVSKAEFCPHCGGKTVVSKLFHA
jgi:DNA-directed RNA polymerase subunit RPC12/RpoP